MSVKIKAALIFLGVCVLGGFFIAATGAHGFVATYIPVPFGTLAAYMCLMLAGNREVKNGSAGDREEALQATLAPGFGSVYVYRNGVLGMAVGMNVSVDGQAQVQLKSPRFTRFTVPAGRHILTTGLSGFAATQNKNFSLPIDVISGESAFFHQTNSMGMLQNQLLLVPEADTPALRQKLRGMTFVLPNGSVSVSTSHVPAPPLVS